MTRGRDWPGQTRTRRTVLAVLAAVVGLGTVGLGAVEPAAAAGECGPGGNEIACENTQPGSPPSQWDVGGDGDPTIQGFATQMSVNAGETIELKIDTPASAYDVEIYRLGYYQGDGARLITTISPSAPLPQLQPSCLTEPTTGLVDCGNWSASASWSVPADAVSGVYQAVLRRNDTGGAAAITFVVRDDNGQSDLLFQTNDATWQAYNNYGGNSLYSGTGPGWSGAAYKVSYNRPLLGRNNNANENNFFVAEYPMVRFLERNGYDVSYFANVDTDGRGGEILEHDAFLSVGHDEYWSAAMRANVTAARDAGVNLAFFSGNAMFWKTRYEPSIDSSATAGRTLVAYKQTHFNIPAAAVDPTGEWTGTWRDPRWASPPDGGWPENEIIGTLSEVNGFRLDAIEVPAEFRDHRLWRNTAVAALTGGATYTMPAGTLGYEWDADLDNGFRPGGLAQMSDTSVTMSQADIDAGLGGIFVDYGHTVAPGTATHNLTMYRAPSGALVFSAATIQWSWGLDANHDAPGTAVDAAMRQATVNLFADMRAQPVTLMAGLTPASASSDVTPADATITAPAANATLSTGQTVVVTGTASDIGGVVAAVEVSTDGATWHPAVGTAGWSSWTYGWVPDTLGPATIRVRAIDDSGNLPTPTTRDVTVVYECPCVIFPTGASPQVVDATDGNSVELGVKFTAEVDGQIDGIRFYKGSGNTGTHVGNLWSSSGSLLASVTFTGESGSGWQQASFSSPVVITANTTYVASYFAPNGGYSYTRTGLATTFDNAPLHAPASAAAGGNGVYRDGASSGFPTATYEASNYWVDVTFSTLGADVTPPTVQSTFPVSGATGVALAAVPSATFSEPVQPATISFSLTTGGSSVAGAQAYSAGTNTVSFTPSAVLSTGATYTATVSAALDAAGNPMSAPVSWSFTTATPDSTPPVISGVAASNVTGSGATIGWSTDEAATSQVDYGLTSSYGSSTALDPTLVTSHAQALGGLASSTTYHYRVRSTDATGNTALGADATFVTGAVGGSCPCSIWDAGVTPSVVSSGDPGAVEVGVKFRADVAGEITGIRFYKGSGNTGTHVGNLWSSSGSLLASVTFTGESGSGWQQASFSSPVAITANTTYVASYFAPNGGWAIDTNFFTASGVVNTPLQALALGVDGGNGVYQYGSVSAFPSSTYAASNYWVDVVFTTEPPA
ncbi:MAG TPA: DUF4082 domain-containing protein [Acidimicrobiia bacterium]|nr:DUF4082 domain-containing protein [Acidimicrobiia bacterium]